MSDPKKPQVLSSILAVFRPYSQSFGILNAIKSSVALSNYYLLSLQDYHFLKDEVMSDLYGYPIC